MTTAEAATSLRPGARHKGLKYLLAIVGVLALVGGLAAVKASQIGTIMSTVEQGAKMGPPPEAVGATTASSQDWEQTLDAVGSVASSQGVSIASEVAGVVKRIAFESGETVRKGEVLVELDSSIERAELASAVASAELAETTAARTRTLADVQAVSADALDQAESQRRTSSARVASLRAQSARKVIRAPFAGQLGIRLINIGEYLNPGTPIAVLESSDSVFVDFDIPQQRMEDVSLGMPVRVDYNEMEGQPLEGSIAAIDPAIDETTRSVKLRASIPNAGTRLRSGMFVNVHVVLPQHASVVSVPLTSVIHASYGDSVFVIEDLPANEPGLRQTQDGKPVRIARQHFVRTGQKRGDFIAILEGISTGKTVVSTGAFKLRNGSHVFVTDQNVPSPQLRPQPENR